MRHHLLVLMMFALQIAVAGAENAVNEKASEFALQDQHEKTVTPFGILRARCSADRERQRRQGTERSVDQSDQGYICQSGRCPGDR